MIPTPATTPVLMRLRRDKWRATCPLCHAHYDGIRRDVISMFNAHAMVCELRHQTTQRPDETRGY